MLTCLVFSGVAWVVIEDEWSPRHNIIRADRISIVEPTTYKNAKTVVGISRDDLTGGALATAEEPLEFIEFVSGCIESAK